MDQETAPEGNPQDDGGNEASFRPPTESGMECTCKRRAAFRVGEQICRWPYEVSILWCSQCRVHLLVLSEEAQVIYCEPVNSPQNVRVDIGLMEIALSTQPHLLGFVTDVGSQVEALFQNLTSPKPSAKPPSKDWV